MIIKRENIPCCLVVCLDFVMDGEVLKGETVQRGRGDNTKILFEILVNFEVEIIIKN